MLSLLKPTLSKVCGDCFAEIVKHIDFHEAYLKRSLLTRAFWDNESEADGSVGGMFL